MHKKPENPLSPPPQNPADIAREAFRRLAARRIAPTPDAYREIFNEVAGITTPSDSMAVSTAAAEVVVSPADGDAVAVLTNFATHLSNGQGEIAELGQRFHRAADIRDWQDYGKTLSEVIDKYLRKTTVIEMASALPVDGHQTRMLRELLARALTFAIASLLQDAPELATESESLGSAVKTAQSDNALSEIASRLKQLCYQIELKTGDSSEQQELLFRLFKLLLDNVSELLEDDSWLHGQIAVVQKLISAPLDHRALEDATRSLKEVIYKQGLLKHSLSEAKVTVKHMMMTFVDRLSSVAESTGDYHQKIDTYTQKISQADNITDLNHILHEVLRETRIVQTEALRSRDKMIAARQEVQDAENRIHELEAKLRHLSELVREDQLTGSLNRRGLDDVYAREAARADRRGSTLCVALLDLDNFKRLNDTMGHLVGDEALVHLVRVVKDTLRTMDVIARFGGEEFLILLPETGLDDAIQTLIRVQRALTRHFFMHQNERVLITFSAGVALRGPNEGQASVVSRADRALYQAKKAGKNRVIAAAAC
jgi:diguanylate cyclase